MSGNPGNYERPPEIIGGGTRTPPPPECTATRQQRLRRLYRKLRAGLAKSGGTAWKCFLATSAVIGFVFLLKDRLPDLRALADAPFDQSTPYGATYGIRNDGKIDALDLHYTCAPNHIVFANGDTFINRNFRPVETLATRSLSPDTRTTVGCGQMVQLFLPDPYGSRYWLIGDLDTGRAVLFRHIHDFPRPRHSEYPTQVEQDPAAIRRYISGLREIRQDVLDLIIDIRHQQLIRLDATQKQDRFRFIVEHRGDRKYYWASIALDDPRIQIKTSEHNFVFWRKDVP